MSEYFKQLNAVAQQIQEAREQLATQAQKSLKPALCAFLKDNPAVERVEWTQYTPHFNDGDTCEFSVNTPSFFFVGFDDEVDFWRPTYASFKEYHADIAEVVDRKTFDACVGFATELDNLEEALHAVFGDHVKVIVTRDGVEVEEYDHD